MPDISSAARRVVSTDVPVVPTLPDPPAAKPTSGATAPPIVERSTSGPVGSILGASPSLAIANATDRRARIDSFFGTANPTFHVDGQDVVCPPNFRMNTGFGPSAGTALGRLQHDLPKGMFTFAELHAVVNGRASPALVARVTQALLDAGKLEPALAARPAEVARDKGHWHAPTDRLGQIQQMQAHYGIGCDCAGYVQQAVANASGKTPAALGFRPALDENLSGLAQNRHFAKLKSPSDLQPGDVMTMRSTKPGDTIGHTLFVADAKAGPPSAPLVPAGSRDRAAYDAFVARPGVRTVTVETSWGAGPEQAGGGVERRTWLYDPGSKQWATLDDDGNLSIGDSPYAQHALTGMFHPKATS